MYVTFSSVSSVQKIYEKTRIMRKVSRIIPYIPREFHARFCCLRDLGKHLKDEKKCPWRVKMGFNDLELSIKDLNSGRWLKVTSPVDCPPVELRNSFSQEESTSPAPGRPEHPERGDKRGRESTDNSPSQIASKLAKHVDSNNDTVTVKNSIAKPRLDREQAWREKLEKAELVTTEAAVSPDKDSDGSKKTTDKGTVTQVSGTPLKILSVQENSVQSPIFTKSSKKPTDKI